MRVVGGIARGRKLKAPHGRALRPSTDRVREAIFDLLGPQGPGELVLDLFSGTGALAIEALSRGASKAVLVEKDSRAIKYIRQNLSSCGFSSLARLVNTDAIRFLNNHSYRQEFDLVLMDPPYGLGLAEKCLELLGEGGWLSEEAIVLCETEGSLVFEERMGCLVLGRVKRYGQTLVHEFLPEDSSVL